MPPRTEWDGIFIRSLERVLSRTSIYEQVWDNHDDGASKTLEVHVMKLRRKLEAHGPRVIHTLRQRGCLLGAPSLGASADGDRRSDGALRVPGRARPPEDWDSRRRDASGSSRLLETHVAA